MNLKMIENLPILSFQKTGYAILLETPAGRFWLKGDRCYMKFEDEEAVFTVPEFLKMRAMLGSENDKMKALKKILIVKKEFNAKIVSKE